MESPIVYLQRRIDQMEAEIDRINNIFNDTEEICDLFYIQKRQNIKEIQGLISGHKRAIKILKQDTGKDINF